MMNDNGVIDGLNALPAQWMTTTIGAIYKVIGGGTPSTSNDEYWGGDVPWITSADIKGVRQLNISRYVTDKGIQLSATNKVPPRTLLVVTRVGLGKIAISNGPICFSQDLQGLVQDPNLILPEYALYYLSYALERLKFEGRGTTISGLTKKQLKDTIFPLAPFKEQIRIVTKIEELFSELDKGVENLETARGQLKIYHQALLKHAFEGKLTKQWRAENKDKLESPSKFSARIKQQREIRYQQQVVDWKERLNVWVEKEDNNKKPSRPMKLQTVDEHSIPLFRIPGDWTWVPLGNLNVEVFDGPFGSNLKTSDYVDAGVRVIRLENVGYLKFLGDNHSYITESKYESIKKHTVTAGDIIVSSFVSDGIRTVVLPKTIARAVNKADCFCVRLHGDEVANDYVAFFLSTRTAYKQIESHIHGIGRPRINTTQLKGFAIPLCNRSEQNEIVSQINEKLSLTDKAAAVIEEELRKCAALRQSVLKKAFSGQLVSQDPSDEPASVLLERIKSAKASAQLATTLGGNRNKAISKRSTTAA